MANPSVWGMLAIFLTMSSFSYVESHRKISQRSRCLNTNETIYDENYQFTSLIDKRNHTLDEYKGNILVIVNTASFWGLTWQYAFLNELHNLPDVTVLGFPCNQFGLQEPGKNYEIMNILKYVRPGNNYVPNFPLFEKVDVNGENEHPLFAFMKDKCDVVTDTFRERNRLFYDPPRPNDIEWNFHKFMIDQDGKVFKRYNHKVHPMSDMILNDIKALQRKKIKKRQNT